MGSSHRVNRSEIALRQSPRIAVAARRAQALHRSGRAAEVQRLAEPLEVLRNLEADRNRGAPKLRAEPAEARSGQLVWQRQPARVPVPRAAATRTLDNTCSLAGWPRRSARTGSSKGLLMREHRRSCDGEQAPGAEISSAYPGFGGVVSLFAPTPETPREPTSGLFRPERGRPCPSGHADRRGERAARRRARRPRFAPTAGNAA